MGSHHTTVECVQMGKLETCPEQDQKAGKLAEEELEIAWAWLHDQDLIIDYNGKEFPPE